MRMVSWEAIFPIPVLRTSLGREFSAVERAYFKEAQADAIRSPGNLRSRDTRVLDAAPLAELRGFVAEHVALFAEKAISSDRRLEFYLTQSWINYTRPGEFHHRHVHSNSLVSGVLYIDAQRETDRLWFFRGATPQIQIGQGQTNWYNADSWFFSVGTGDLVLFPSQVQHEVEKLAGDATRVSLAFNAFVRGAVGESDNLNALTL